MAGDAEWWRLREAALLAVGAVAEPILEVQAQQDQPALDIPALLHNVLQEDLLTPNAPPFLTGRALWMAARCCLAHESVCAVQANRHEEWSLWAVVAALYAASSVLVSANAAGPVKGLPGMSIPPGFPTFTCSHTSLYGHDSDHHRGLSASPIVTSSSSCIDTPFNLYDLRAG